MSDLKMPDLNKVFLAGRLTRDPELKYSSSGTAMCRIGLAVTRSFKGKDGERKDDTFFVNVTAWEKLAEYCNNYLKKGRPVMVEGRLRGNEWVDPKTEQKRSTIDIQASSIQTLDWEDRGGGSSGGSSGSAPRNAPRDFDEPIPEDDVPF